MRSRHTAEAQPCLLPVTRLEECQPSAICSEISYPIPISETNGRLLGNGPWPIWGKDNKAKTKHKLTVGEISHLLTPWPKDGVKSLADPGVEADWSDKILQTLYELSSHQLALQYATISKHRSDIPEDIILRMKLFVKCDIVRAFYFQVSLHASERGSGLSIFLF
jgi:hypothetical protein